MLSETDRAVVGGQADLTLMNAAWQRIRQHLEEEKQRIFQEIRCYPPPIPACDVQFNGLLEERVTILQELGKVEGILKQDLTVEEQMELLDEFLRSSHNINGELADLLRQSLPMLPG